MSNSYRRIFIPLVSLAFCSCAPGGDPGPAPAPKISSRCADAIEVDSSCHLPMAAILANPESFSGTDVSFIGFLAGGGVPGFVYLGREEWMVGDRSSAIRLVNGDLEGLEHWRTGVPDAKYGYVLVRGEVQGVGTGRQPNIEVLPLELTMIHAVNDFRVHEQALIRAEQNPD